MWQDDACWVTGTVYDHRHTCPDVSGCWERLNKIYYTIIKKMYEHVEMHDGRKRIDEIRTQEIRTRTGVTNISEKIREAGLGWLEHAGLDRRTWRMEVSMN